jgi:hypothetical protein
MSVRLGRGWATVDLDRAGMELRDLLATDCAFEDAPRSEWLGARCRVGRAVGRADSTLVLLEPDTEGRLAAFLARHGEGWAADYVVDDRGSGRWRPGPLGPEEPAPDQPTGDPILMLVTRRTIDR